MRAIITGPTGAVGISLIQELCDHGWEVVAVARPHSKRLDAIPRLKNVTVVECALENIKDLSDYVEGKADVFYHFGWDGTYGNSRLDVQEQNKNVGYTLEAVSSAKKLGCSVFVGAGSQSEFGHVQGVLHPDMPCRPDNGYGAAKLAACHMSRVMCNNLGIRHEWCRIVSLYGPFDGDHTMVMSVIRNLLEGRKPSCTNGDQIWDYIYSKDAARAFRLVAESGKDGEIYCFGTGKTRTLRQYIEVIRDTIDSNLEIGFGELPYYQNQVMHLEADIANLKNDTGFEPRYTFEEGIRETIDWMKKRVEQTGEKDENN